MSVGFVLFVLCMYWPWRSNYQEGGVGIPLTSLTPSGPGFPLSYVCRGLLFMFSELKREATVRFIDIGRIIDHHARFKTFFT